MQLDDIDNCHRVGREAPYFIFLLLFLYYSVHIGTVSLLCTLFYKDCIMLIDLLPECHVKIFIQNDRTGIQFEILQSPKLMWCDGGRSLSNLFEESYNQSACFEMWSLLQSDS